MFYTYVLKSNKDKKLYIGFTNDLKKRIAEHNIGKVSATAKRKPMKIVYYESCANKMDAIDRERQLKTGYGRAYLKRRLKNAEVAQW